MRPPWILLAATGCAWDLLASAPVRGGTPRLPPCASGLRCVHSGSSPGSTAFIAPLPASPTEEETLDQLRAVLKAEPRATVLRDAPPYLHAQFVTRIWRFRDDTEFRYDADEGVLHVRSESRIGGSDLGANRARVERIRVALQQSGL